MLSYDQVKSSLKNKVIKSSGVYDPDCRFDRLSCEARVDPICLCLNIEKKSHLNFFKVKPFFFTDYPSCFTTYQVDLVILKQLSLKLIFKLGLDKESCHEVSKLSCRVKFNNIAK